MGRFHKAGAVLMFLTLRSGRASWTIFLFTPDTAPARPAGGCKLLGHKVGNGAYRLPECAGQGIQVKPVKVI